MREEFTELCSGEAFLKWLQTDPEPGSDDALVGSMRIEKPKAGGFAL
jgi:hypothetical protein